MIGNGAPVFGVLHAVQHGAVAAGRLAEAAPVLAHGKGPQLAVDERNQFPG